MYDIESYVSRNFTDYKYYGVNKTDISICCPFCPIEDTKYHLQISLNPDKQVCHCFRCGYASSWVNFVMRVSGLTYYDAMRELYIAPRAKVDMRKYVRGKVVNNIMEMLHEEFKLPPDFALLNNAPKSKLRATVRNYLLSRGYGKDVWIKYSLGIAPSIGYRVIIPIENGYWQARSVLDIVVPKYINPMEHSRSVLFNADALEMYDEIVICEGFFSAISVGDNAIALIGKEATPEKMDRILKASASNFILALEADAFSSMKKLADALCNAGKNVTIWKYNIGDPADSKDYDSMQYNLKTKVYLSLN